LQATASSIVTPSGGVCGQSRHIKQDAASVDPQANHADATLIGALRLPGFKADDPIMQGAGHGMAMHDALTQRTLFVRAGVAQREYDAIGGPEDAYVALRGRDDA
jgi:hypothetical protein